MTTDQLERREDAKGLGQLGAHIGMGKKPRIKDGPWWREDIIERFRSQLQ